LEQLKRASTGAYNAQNLVNESLIFDAKKQEKSTLSGYWHGNFVVDNPDFKKNPPKISIRRLTTVVTKPLFLSIGKN